jgi:hypothetical protein
MSASQLTADDRENMRQTFNRTVGGQSDLGNFLKTLMQKLDADLGVSGNDYESLLTPD